MDAATFVGREGECGRVEIGFTIRVEAASHATKILRRERVTLLPTYRGGGAFFFVLEE